MGRAASVRSLGKVVAWPGYVVYQVNISMNEISDEIYNRIANHLRNGTTDLAETDLNIPAMQFVSPEWAAQELDLFRKLPLIVAHSSELAGPGSYVTREVLGKPVLLVRQDDGQPKAFLNMCRHRGGLVEQAPSGTKRVFVCRYHGWSYERSGKLRGVPYEQSYEPIDRQCRSLKQIRVAEHLGFIWLQFEGEGELSIADYLGPDANAQLESFGLGGAKIVTEGTFELKINWKLVADGALDILHAPFLHPEGVDKLVTSHAGVWRDFGRHGQLFTVRKKVAEQMKVGEQVDRGSKNFTANLSIFPNAIIFVTPDHVEFWTIWPSPCGRKSTTHIRLLARPDILDDRMLKRINRSWDILKQAALQEDWPMAATIQANAEANPDSTFLYGRGELTCQHLHRELRKMFEAAQIAP